MLDSSLQRLLSRSLRLVLVGAVLPMCATSVQGQLPGQGPGQPPANPNEPNKPTHHHEMSTKDLQEKLKKGMDSKNAAYAGSSIQTAVDDQSVTLNGTVTSELQHEMALQLVRAYAGDRKIVDRLVVR